MDPRRPSHPRACTCCQANIPLARDGTLPEMEASDRCRRRAIPTGLHSTWYARRHRPISMTVAVYYDNTPAKRSKSRRRIGRVLPLLHSNARSRFSLDGSIEAASTGNSARAAKTAGKLRMDRSLRQSARTQPALCARPKPATTDTRPAKSRRGLRLDSLRSGAGRSSGGRQGYRQR